MAELVLCAECNRHVRGAACPFCGARVAEGRSSSRGRASRAAVFALAAAAPVALLECKEPAHVVMYGGPPTATVAAPVDAAAPSASATPQAPVVAPSETTHVSAYGGPPAALKPVPPPR